MPVVIYAVPALVAAHQAAGSFEALRQTWTGWDGSTWVLSDPDEGVFLTDGGVAGMGQVPSARFSSVAPGVAGSRFRGARALERPVMWNLHVYSDVSSAAWVDRDRAFWRTMRTDRVGRWTVQQVATNTTRYLDCRFVSTDDTYPRDPVLAGWADYEVHLVADDPYWRGAPVGRAFAVAGDPVDFLPAAPGDPFVISEGSSLASATIENPGDVEAWPVWTITGPTTDVTVGIGDSLVGIPGDLDEGDVLVIDTDPRRQSATLNGVRTRGILAPHDFAPIPAGGVSGLSLAMTGTGAVSVQIVPRYLRAW